MRLAPRWKATVHPVVEAPRRPRGHRPQDTSRWHRAARRREPAVSGMAHGPHQHPARGRLPDAGRVGAACDCYLIWPERPDNWRWGGKPAQAAFAAVAEAIAEAEPVTVLVSPAQYTNARERLPLHIRVVEMSTNDSWVRDSGPTFVVNDAGELRGVLAVQRLGRARGRAVLPVGRRRPGRPKVLDIERVPRYLPDFVLEGGSIDVDGEGTVLTTEECLLNPNRNPDLDRRRSRRPARPPRGRQGDLVAARGLPRRDRRPRRQLRRFVAPGHGHAHVDRRQGRSAVGDHQRGAQGARDGRPTRRAAPCRWSRVAPARPDRHHRRGGGRRRPHPRRAAAGGG